MLKHVSFLTRNADRVIGFYTSLGAEVVKDLTTPEGWRRVVLRFADGGRLQFFQMPGEAPTPHPAWAEHIALQLPDLNGAVQRLRAEHTVFTREPTLSPSGTPMAFVRDPDGRQVELLQDREV